MTAGNVSPWKVQGMHHERDQSSNGITSVIDVAQRRGHAGKQPTRQKCGLDLETVSRVLSCADEFLLLPYDVPPAQRLGSH